MVDASCRVMAVAAVLGSLPPMFVWERSVMPRDGYGDQCGGGSGVSRAEVGLGTERQGTERHAEVKSCAKSCVNGLLNVCHSAHETNSRWNVSSVSFTLFMKTVLAGMCRTRLSLCS